MHFAIVLPTSQRLPYPAMKHSLQLKLSQHLTLTPQLQQSIRLLQLSTLELNQEIERFLQENPLLERDEGAEDDGGAAPPAAGPCPDRISPAPPRRLPSEKEDEEPLRAAGSRCGMAR